MKRTKRHNTKSKQKLYPQAPPVPLNGAERRAFLSSFSRLRASLDKASIECGISFRRVQHTIDTDPDFKREIEYCWRRRIDQLECVALDRATYGWNEPVYHDGEMVGTKRVFSAPLTIFMLTKNRPDKYDKAPDDNRLESPEELAHKLNQFLSTTLSTHLPKKKLSSPHSPTPQEKNEAPHSLPPPKIIDVSPTPPQKK